MAAGMERLMQLVAVIAAVAAYLVVASGTALADERLCSQLETQLAALPSGSGGSVQYSKYDKAIALQSERLRVARGRARVAGCGFSLFGSGRSQCGTLSLAIERMEKNLSALQGKRTQLAGNSGSKRQRQRLLASLDANGCRNKTTAQKPQMKWSSETDIREAAVFDRLFDGGIRQSEELQNPRNVRRVEVPRYFGEDSDPHSRYRTMCVRTCDGYYFPISPASSMQDLERDQQNCEAMCPGTDARIYYQPSGDEDTEAMVSFATGEPYADLPAAFRYRQPGMTRPQGCGCNPAKNFSVIAGNPPSSWKIIDTEADSQPSQQSSGSITTFGTDSTGQPDQAASDATTKLPPPGERKVRVVGPMFLPDPEGAIDLRAPVQKKVQ